MPSSHPCNQDRIKAILEDIPGDRAARQVLGRYDDVFGQELGDLAAQETTTSPHRSKAVYGLSQNHKRNLWSSLLIG